MKTIFDFTDDKEILYRATSGISKEDYLKYNSKDNKLIDLYDYFRFINNIDQAMFYLNQIKNKQIIKEILYQDIIFTKK